jgi:AraC-like DNA-binding protein
MSDAAEWFHRTMPGASFSLHRRTGSGRAVTTGPTHANPGFELSWITSGALEFVLGPNADRSVAATTGASVLLPPGLLNTPRVRAHLVHQTLIAPDLFEEAADALGSEGRVPLDARVIGADTSVSAVAKALAIESSSVDVTDPAIEALIHALVLGLVRSPERSRLHERCLEPGIRRAVEYIEQEYRHAISVDDLARIAGLSRFVFLRKFSAQAVESPHRHLTAVRLDRAAERLRTTRRSVLAIALEHGFGDPSRFARAFAKRFGCTPARWRARSA